MSAARQRRKRYAALDVIYARIPPMRCRGLCTEACGPIAMSRLEWERIEEVRGAPMPGYGPVTNSCPLLTRDGRCSVYEVRPLICRLWGAILALPCPHGCGPARPLTLPEVLALQRGIDALSGTTERWLMPEEWPTVRAEMRARIEAAGNELARLHTALMEVRR